MIGYSLAIFPTSWDFGKFYIRKKTMWAFGPFRFSIHRVTGDLSSYAVAKGCPCCGYPNCGHEHPKAHDGVWHTLCSHDDTWGGCPVFRR
jgi:hypothetical protein